MDASTSRFLVALASLVLNLGARHLPNGLSPRMQLITSSDGMRTLVLCALFYLSTRDVMLSVALAFVFFAITSTLLNEHSRYSMLQRLHTQVQTQVQAQAQAHVPVSSDAYDAAVETVLRFRRQARHLQQLKFTTTGHAPARP